MEESVQKIYNIFKIYENEGIDFTRYFSFFKEILENEEWQGIENYAPDGFNGTLSQYLLREINAMEDEEEKIELLQNIISREVYTEESMRDDLFYYFSPECLVNIVPIEGYEEEYCWQYISNIKLNDYSLHFPLFSLRDYIDIIKDSNNIQVYLKELFQTIKIDEKNLDEDECKNLYEVSSLLKDNENRILFMNKYAHYLYKKKKYLDAITIVQNIIELHDNLPLYQKSNNKLNLMSLYFYNKEHAKALYLFQEIETGTLNVEQKNKLKQLISNLILSLTPQLDNKTREDIIQKLFKKSSL